MEQSKSERLEQLKKRNIAPTLTNTMEKLVNHNIETATYMKFSYAEWRKELAWQCGVFVFGEHYIGKRFYQINYVFCENDTAKEIVSDNLYAILRYKYFSKLSDEIDDKIREIVKNFTMNLASTLIRVSFDEDDDCEIVKHIPDWCVAFKNGVFDFKNNDWLFKYDITKLEELSNRIYSYDSKYIIQWYFNYDFEPIADISIMETTIEDFVKLMVMVEEDVKYVGLNEPRYDEKNICFELMYNMAHDSENKFDMKKFAHLCEVIGYMVHVSFLQYFVLLIGSGRNGKNSLFDGCFSSRVIPMPTQNSMLDIETDKFITGTLENKFHNIYLETDEKSVSLGASTKLKQLTGSELQTSEKKGVDKRSTNINCKYLFSANEQEKIKFGDLSDGFRRRINMYEVFYQFVPSVEKLKKKSLSYYYTPFKQDLSDIKSNRSNTTMFVYLAMYGIKCATKSFTRNFEFHKTDWNDSYSDLDLDIKDKILSLSINKIISYMTSTPVKWNECKKMMYDTGEMYDDRKPKPLYLSDTLKVMGYSLNHDSLYKLFKNEDDLSSFFANNDIYIAMKDLQAITGDSLSSLSSYVSNFKKLFPGCIVLKLNNNKPYVMIRIQNGKMRVLTNK